MKIIYFYQHFVLPEKSGITRTFEFAKRLSSLGHEVHLIASDESLSDVKPAPYVTNREGINIHWLPIPYHNKMPFYRRIIAFLQYIVGAFKVAYPLSFDIVYVSSPPLTSTLSAVVLSKLKRVPLVLEVRDLWPDLPVLFGALSNPISITLAKWLEKLAYRNASHVVALSPGIQRAVSSRGVRTKNITIIPNSCDFALFKSSDSSAITLPRGIKDSDSLVFYPGTVGIANQISYIVRLASELLEPNPSIKFLIVGDGREKKAAIEMAKKLNVFEKNLFFLDAIPKSEIPALFQRANLIINTLVNKKPLWNSSPNKFFDALAAGKPVAINFNGWLAELIETHECGLVLDPEDISAAAEKISKALSHPLWVEGAGRRAHHLGKTQFDRDILFNRLHDVFLTLVNPTSNPHMPLRKISPS